MRILYSKTLNIAFIFFNKSGSSLLIAWMESLLTYLKVEYELLSYTDVETQYQNIRLLNSNKSKLYFFVRNPLERIITSFYWMETFDIKSKENKFPINDFVEYANSIEEKVEKIWDMHILPQSWLLVYGNNVINGRENSLREFQTFRYDKRFFKDCNIKIIKIETIKKNFEALMGFASSICHYPQYKEMDKIGETFYFQRSFGQLEEIFANASSMDKLNAISLYNFYDTHFKTLPHHNNLYKEMLNELWKTKIGVESLIKVNSIVENESKWLGYDNSVILNTNKFN